MTSFVIDASIAVSWFLPDEQTNDAQSVLKLISTGTDVRAPTLWAYEVRNSILKGVRRGRIARPAATSLMALFESLPIRLVEPESYTALFHLAERSNLTVYDAAYLHLALRESLPLASLDRALCDAPIRLGAGLFQPPVS